MCCDGLINGVPHLNCAFMFSFQPKKSRRSSVRIQPNSQAEVKLLISCVQILKTKFASPAKDNTVQRAVLGSIDPNTPVRYEHEPTIIKTYLILNALDTGERHPASPWMRAA